MNKNRAPALNPGLEAGAAVLRSTCNAQGGYYTPDGQCLGLKPPSPPILPPQRSLPPSYNCTQIGNTTTCTPY